MRGSRPPGGRLEGSAARRRAQGVQPSPSSARWWPGRHVCNSQASPDQPWRHSQVPAAVQLPRPLHASGAVSLRLAPRELAEAPALTPGQEAQRVVNMRKKKRATGGDGKDEKKHGNA